MDKSPTFTDLVQENKGDFEYPVSSLFEAYGILSCELLAMQNWLTGQDEVINALQLKEILVSFIKQIRRICEDFLLTKKETEEDTNKNRLERTIVLFGKINTILKNSSLIDNPLQKGRKLIRVEIEQEQYQRWISEINSL